MELLFKEVAPVAHLDRAIASGAIGREFEPRRVHHFFFPLFHNDFYDKNRPKS